VVLGLFLSVWVAAASAELAEHSGTADVAAMTQVETSGFLYTEIEIDRDSARTGNGQQVALGDFPVSLHGREIKVGDKLRSAKLKDSALREVSIADESKRVRILSVVPAVETPTCEQQTHYLSEKSGDLGEQVELVTISLDPPKVQKEFAQEAGIENVVFLSDANDAAFGRAHGLLIEDPLILARAILVVDTENVVRYMQVVPDVSHMPDMEAAFMFARLLLPVEEELPTAR